MSLRADNEQALAILDRRHSFHAVDGKVHDHLLQLDSIPTDRRKARRELEPYRHSMPERLVLHQRNRLLDDPVDVELRHLRVGLLREVANPADHLVFFTQPQLVDQFCAVFGRLKNVPGGRRAGSVRRMGARRFPA